MLEFTKNIAQYINKTLPNKNFSLDISWLVPIKHNLTDQDIVKVFQSFPEAIASQIINSETGNIKNFFQNDYRALKKYLQVLPVGYILKQEKLPNKIEEFNRFFKENYINNESYKLTQSQEQIYIEQIAANNQLKWDDFILQQAKNNSLNSQDVNPNYSLDFFFSQSLDQRKLLLQNQQKVPHLDFQYNPELNSKTSPLNQSKYIKSQIQSSQINFNKPTQSIPTKSEQTVVQDYSFQSSINSSSSNLAEKNTSRLSSQSIEASFRSTSNIDYSSIAENKAITHTSNISPQEQYSHENHPKPSKSTKNTTLEQNIKTRTERQESKNRQKGFNYAKIVGLATGLSLGGVTGLSTLLTILTGN